MVPSPFPGLSDQESSRERAKEREQRSEGEQRRERAEEKEERSEMYARIIVLVIKCQTRTILNYGRSFKSMYPWGRLSYTNGRR